MPDAADDVEAEVKEDSDEPGRIDQESQEYLESRADDQQLIIAPMLVGKQELLP